MDGGCRKVRRLESFNTDHRCSNPRRQRGQQAEAWGSVDRPMPGARVLGQGRRESPDAGPAVQEAKKLRWACRMEADAGSPGTLPEGHRVTDRDVPEHARSPNTGRVQTELP